MNTPDTESVIGQVELLMERKRFDQARALLGSALKNDPDHPELLLQSAWLEYFDAKAGNALETVHRVLEDDPRNPSAQLLHFEILLKSDAHSQAEKVILALLREYPENAHYYGRYARLLLQALNFEKAQKVALEGLRYDPDNVACLIVETICGFITRPRRGGNRSLQKLIVQHPEAVNTLRLVIVGLVQRDDYRSARRLAEELVRQYPNDESIVDLSRTLRLQTHWSLWPLWPMRRFGWGGSAAIWLVAVVSVTTLEAENSPLTGAAVAIFLVYVVYSWVWPWALRRLLGA